MRTTTVVWAAGTPTPEQNSEILAQASLMQSEGKTDGTYTVTNVDGQNHVVRPWTDEVSAGEWVAFIVAYNPVSAEVDPIQSLNNISNFGL